MQRSSTAYGKEFVASRRIGPAFLSKKQAFFPNLTPTPAGGYEILR
jgi:hypothetical protein